MTEEGGVMECKAVSVVSEAAGVMKWNDIVVPDVCIR